MVGLGSGAAYAYFTGPTSHSVARSGGVKPVTVVAASGTPSSTLVPNSSADLLVEIDNPNGFPVEITGVTQNGPLAVSGGVGCTATNSGVSVPTQTGLSISVGTGEIAVNIPNGIFMSSTSNSGCQGAEFRPPIMLTVRSS